MQSLGTFNGVLVYSSNDPGGAVIPAALINSYSSLTIPAYYRAINVLANNLANFPRSVYENGQQRDVTHPLDRILKRRPNGYQNCYVLYRTWFAHAAHHGNGFLRIQRAKNGVAIDSLHNMLPGEVLPFRVDTVGDGSGWQQFYVWSPPKC